MKVASLCTTVGNNPAHGGGYCYNLGRFLPATLASLAAQTYPRLDVVVIDDGSTDPESARYDIVYVG